MNEKDQKAFDKTRIQVQGEILNFAVGITSEAHLIHMLTGKEAPCTAAHEALVAACANIMEQIRINKMLAPQDFKRCMREGIEKARKDHKGNIEPTPAQVEDIFQKIKKVL